VAEHALRVLLHDGRAGLAIGEDLTLPVQAVTGTRDALVQQALDRRQELRALLLLVEGNESLATARAGQRWPRLAVQGNLDYANPNQRVFPQEERFDATWDVSAVLTWSPSDLFTANAEVAQASAQAEQARADIEALSDGVRLEVTQAYETHASASAQLEAATAGIAAAEESYRVRQQQLAAGAAATSEVIDAEAELSRARLQYLDAQIDVRIARARLLRAIGP
jgi:outer membrane protein TolC